MGIYAKSAGGRVRWGVIPIFVAGTLSALSVPASADFVFDSNITTLGTGFGAVPRMLTVEQTGSDKINPNGVESACDGNSGGSLSIGQCSGVDASFQPNGWIVPNSADSVTGGKDALVTLSNAATNGQAITNANQIFIVYNPSQEGTSPWTNIVDITLKFYDSNNAFLGSVDGGCGNNCTNTSADPLYFADAGTNLGNGGTGFTLRLDAAQIAFVNTLCGVNMVNCLTMALEVTIANANDGPDSFYLYTPATIPEPLTLTIFGAGLLGAAGLRRKLKKA